MFGVVYAAEATAPEVLGAIAREFSPRIEICAGHALEQGGIREIVLDLSGLTRLFGDARTIAEELRRTAADRGVRVRVAIAGTRTAARLLVRHRAGLTVIEPGMEASALALLPLVLLGTLDDGAKPQSTDQRSKTRPAPLVSDIETSLRRWGLRTLGDLVALPADEVSSRLGLAGVEWQRLARGDDPAPLVPSAPEERFEQTLDLEWPIDGLEPLSFVLGRLMEPLSAHLERRDRGAAVLHVRLRLITLMEDGAEGGAHAVHERSLQLPAPIRDARTLRTLVLLDLESHPPSAAIDRVTIAVDPTPARVVQFSLITRPLPSPEQLSTLLARLTALMGEDRCGSPTPVDTWRPGAFVMKSFAPVDVESRAARHENQRKSAPSHVEGRCVGAVKDAAIPSLALRRFRVPVPARVQVEDGRPARVVTDRRGWSGGAVESCAGPWRTSGGWWDTVTPGWDRDEWDASLADGATYRIFRERDTGRWFLDGVVD